MEEITSKCSCTFKVDSENFRCRGAQGNFENTVVFRGRITVHISALTISADDIVNIIDDWVGSSPLIIVSLITFGIDPIYLVAQQC